MPALLANKLSLWGSQESSKYVFPMGSCIDLLDNEQYVSATGSYMIMKIIIVGYPIV